jgi:hypothetical protein
MLQNTGVIAPERIGPVAEPPYQLHVDHLEGLELWPEAGDGGLLIIYDAPPPERTDPDTLTVGADVICPKQAEDGRSWTQRLATYWLPGRKQLKGQMPATL